MKKWILFVLAGLPAGWCLSQPRVIGRAIVKMQTEITFPENMGGGPGGGDGNVTFARPGGMEASTTLYVKGDMSKVESQTDFGNNIVITDRKNKKTTTLIEAMGRKTGFYTTEDDEARMRSRMDSARTARADSLRQLGLPIAQPSKPEIQYLDESKKIAGYNCKKAIIRSKTTRGEVNEATVWYSPDFKMAEGMGIGGGGRGMMMMAGMNGLDELNGFPMEYEFERGNGMKIHMVVTKVQLEPSIDDKTFDIPKGFDVKPASEMQGERGGMRMRIGGN